MIKKSLLVAFTALVTFQVLLPVIPRRWALSPGLRRENLRRAERYLDVERATAHCVAVGSSLSLALNEQVLGQTRVFWRLAVLRRSPDWRCCTARRHAPKSS